MLIEGDNQITITATDAATNESIETFFVKGRDRTPPNPPSVFEVISPTKLRFQTIEGTAEPGSTVTIAGGMEPVTAQAASGNGLFVANVNLNSGINNLTVAARDSENNESSALPVSITSNPGLNLPPIGTPAQINVSTGNTQKGAAGAELPRPLVAIVTDRDGDPVQNATVRFTVQAGGGQFVSGGSTVEIQTDSLGHASTRYVSGASPGLQQIRADFGGNVLTPAVFLAEALPSPVGNVTSVSGVVVDQNLRALPNVIVRMSGQQTRTASNGRFIVSNIPAGPHQLLELIGRDQVTLPGRWPNITYDFDVLPGVENQLGRPLFLPRVNEGINLPLDQNNVVLQDTTYELPVVGGERPIKVTAKAGTRVIFPPDVTDRRLSVTRIATNRVPMTLEDGRATNLYISVQPSGAVFETPLEISFPNLDRLATNSEVLLMSFDHDAGRYVRVGTGRVSSDGREVKSDAGTGIRVGAWHALPPPEPDPEVTVLGHVQIKDNPTFEGRDLINNEAWVEGTRAILISGSPISSDLIRLNYRASFSLPRNSAPRSVKMEALTQTQAPTISVSPQTVFVGVDKTVEVTATLTSAASGIPSFKWKSDSDSTATVQFASGHTEQSSPNRVVITGKKAGVTKIKVEYKSSSGGKVSAEVQVNVVKVEFTGVPTGGVCYGFDNTKVPQNPPHEPLWLTVVMNGTFEQPIAGTTNQVNAVVTPAAAANRIQFNVTDQNIATINPQNATNSPQTVTVTSVARGEAFVIVTMDGVELARLGVVVRRKYQIPVTFHFVSDSNSRGQRNHSTNRATTQAQADTVAANFVREMNAILTPQTGIEYVLRNPGGAVLDQHPDDLGRIVSYADFPAIRTLTNPQREGQEYYFVWEIERDEQIPTADQNGVVTRINATNQGADTFVDDSANFNDIAHEAAHSIFISPTNPYPGEPAHSNVLRELLFPTGNGRGCLIPKRDADTSALVTAN
ncbi:MAG: hypothetical protein ACKVQW_10755 [Pyrinomonadaceae bacterium]